MKIYLGTCGWAYREWVGKFYPEGTRPSINHYTSFFSALEIDSTYYSIPPRETFENTIRRISEGIRLSVKLPSSVSHFGDGEQRKKSMEEFRKNVLNPARKRNKDAMFLFTIPPWINAEGLESYLISMSEIAGNEGNIFCEPRLFREDNFSNILRLIERTGFHASFTDNAANHLELQKTGNKKAYVRLHGRNSLFSEKGSGMEKFDYSYSETELESLKNKILKFENDFEEVFIFFNNHPHGNAPLNAMELGRIMGINKMQRFT